MITQNPKKFWLAKSKKKRWREYILPGRNDKDFHDEGLQQAKFLEEYYFPNDIVLEYGCGIGRILKHIKARRKIGLDIVPKFISIAKQDLNSEYYLIDEFKETADFIYSISVIQHNVKEEREIMMKNIFNLLRTGGSALINFPHENSDVYDKKDLFVHVFTKKEVEEYGKMFDKYDIFEGNLVNYAGKKTNKNNEYFLLVGKL